MLLHLLLIFGVFTAISCRPEVVFPGEEGPKVCVTNRDQKVGVCKGFAECLSVRDELQKGIRPTRCRYGRYHGVCCANQESTSIAPTPEKIVNFFEKFSDVCGKQSFIDPSDLPKANLTLETLVRPVEEVLKPVFLPKLEPPFVPPFEPPFREPEHVVGGIQALINGWPWMALLGDGTRWFCGGALISDRHILTAAHCFSLTSKPAVVRLGEHDIGVASETTHVDVPVSAVIKHPQYNITEIQHDIAVVILSSPVQFSASIAPICVPKGFVTPESEEVAGTITGWGTTSFGGISSDTLQQVSVPIVNKKACEASYKALASFSLKFPAGFPQQLFCAAAEGGGKDACQGDSGGPFMVQQEGRYTIEGIVSAGQGCGSEQFPGLYTWVYPYMSWIQSVATP